MGGRVFDCSSVRAEFAIATRSLDIIPGLVKAEKVGPDTANKLASVALTNKERAESAASAAGHSECLGKKACQIALKCT